MIMYILAANSQINPEDYNKTVVFNRSEIQARLGSFATTEDAVKFRDLWRARFVDVDEAAPTFYYHEDLDVTWTEIQSKI